MQTVSLQGSRLSRQQTRLWSWQQADQTYRTQCSILLEGALDVQMLQRAIQQVVGRHEILHTVFYPMRDMNVPMQIVDTHMQVACPLVDLEDLPAHEQMAQRMACFNALLHVPFDLAHGPLLRVTLLRTHTQQHTLILSLPALCADISTLVHLVSEIHQLYAASLMAEEELEEPLQYIDVSAWQDTLLGAEDAAKQQAYWRKVNLSGLATQPLAFMRDIYRHGSAKKQPFVPEMLDVSLEDALGKRLLELAHSLGVAPEVVLLTCWQVLLWRLGTQAPVLVGVACNGRQYEELSNALGLYTRLVPFSTSFSASQPFERILLRVNAALQEAIEEQLYFTWSTAHTSSEDGGNGQMPAFFPLAFAYEAWPLQWTTPNLTFALDRQHSYLEPFALLLRGVQVGTHLRVELHYDGQQLSASAVARLAHSLRSLLAHVLQAPQTPACRLLLQEPEEQRSLLQHYGHTQRTLPTLTLQQLFEAQVEQRPNAVAVVSGSVSLTYRQLNQQANQLAHALRRNGVGPNVQVGLCMERSVFMLSGLLAILKAGGAYVPLEPEHPQARLAHQLQQAQAPLVLTQEALRARLQWWSGPLWCLDGAATLWEHEADYNPPTVSGPKDLSYVIYTSGSTGLPKGVLISQQGVSNYIQAMCSLLEVEPGLQFATVSTLAADLGNTAIFLSLASGGCLHVLPYELLISGEHMVAYVQQQAIDVLKIVPSHLLALLNSCGGQEQALLPRRYLILGGEAFPASLRQRLQEWNSPCRVLNHYGPTEATIGALVNNRSMVDAGVTGARGVTPLLMVEEGIVPIGQPLANMEAYVLDEELQVMPVGVSGELYLGGAGLAIGYLQQPEETAARFIPHPWSQAAGARLYRTGDLAYYTPAQQIVYVGRIDNQVKIRGYRIELGEIEAVLRRHPQVGDCAVVAHMEGGDAHLTAYLVAKPPSAPTQEELRRFLELHLPAYMVPASLLFLRALPMTANGKVDRRQLTTTQWKTEQAVSTTSDQSSEPKAHVQPRDELEFQLLRIWEEVLNIRPISVLSNFFELGGHSILAIRLISHIHRQCGQDLGVAVLFQAPTIAELALILRQKTAVGQRSALVKIQPHGTKRPFFCIHPAGGTVFCYSNLASHIGLEQPFYGLQAPELSATKTYFSTLEEMATYYIAAMQTVQPQGPYLLGGWSLGGVIAFEMAQQLQRQGHEIALLAIIDSVITPPGAPIKEIKEPEIDDAALARELLDALSERAVLSEDFPQLAPEEQLKYAVDFAKSIDAIPRDAEIDQARHLLILNKMNVHAARTYVPQPYPQRLTLFRAEASVRDNKDNEDGEHPNGVTRGWEKVVADEGDIDVYIIPGKHREIVEEPNVQLLAQALKQCIDTMIIKRR